STADAANAVPVLRWPHDHHRDLRARLRAKAPPHTYGTSNQDRHLLMLSPSFHKRSDARLSCWLLVGSAHARLAPLASPAIAPPILPRNLRSARSRLRAQPCFAAKPSEQTRRPNLLQPYAVKSP